MYIYIFTFSIMMYFLSRRDWWELKSGKRGPAQRQPNGMFKLVSIYSWEWPSFKVAWVEGWYVNPLFICSQHCSQNCVFHHDSDLFTIFLCPSASSESSCGVQLLSIWGPSRFGLCQLLHLCWLPWSLLLCGLQSLPLHFSVFCEPFTGAISTHILSA